MSIRSADDCFAVALGVPGDADAGLNVVGVGLNSFLQSQKCYRREGRSGEGREFRRKLHIVANTIVQGEIGRTRQESCQKTPSGLLENESLGTADALNEVSGNASSVGLHRD